MTDLLDVEFGLGDVVMGAEDLPTVERGRCRVCGEAATTERSTYCADHKTPQSRSSQTGVTDTLPKAGTTPERPVGVERPKQSQGRTPTGRKGAPSADEWSSKIFDKSVILVTAMVAASAVRRYNVNDPDDKIADTLTATDDEARRIARPVSRFMAGTNLNRRVGRKVLDNSDLLDAGFALYDWYDRVNKTLKTFAGQTHLASVTNIRPEGAPDEPTVTPTANTGTAGGDFPDFGPPPLVL